MKIKYKRIKVPMPHCGDCGEELMGDGSLAFPYRCKCGTWRLDLKDFSSYVLNQEKDITGKRKI